MIPTPKNLPIPAGQARYWGNPWHGLCRNSLIELPNGGTRANPNPLNGSTVVVKNTAKAGLPATRPLASYDTAQGHSWLTFCILAGTSKQVAGTDLGSYGFIYVDHRHRPWHMKFYGNNDNGLQLWVIRRFGLFGDDPVSWVQNRLIYNGDFGRQPVQNISIAPDDICQNHDGSSVLVNFRLVGATPTQALQDLWRVVDVTVTSSDAGSENNIQFDVGYSELVTPDDVDVVDMGEWGDNSSPGATETLIASSVEHHVDDKPAAICGTGPYLPGTYHDYGSLSASSAGTDCVGQTKSYGNWEHRKRVFKAYYRHDGSLQVLSIRYDIDYHADVDYSCSANYNADWQETITIGVSGQDQYNRDCSSGGTFTASASIIGQVNQSRVTVGVTTWSGGLYINDVPAITWERHNMMTQEWWAQSSWSYSFSDGGSLPWSNPPPELAALFTMTSTAIAGQSFYPAGTAEQASDTVVTNDITQTVDGTTVATDEGYPILNNHYIREYANNIHALLLMETDIPEGDPTNPAWAGQWGLVAESVKVVTGTVLDTTFYASLNPVDGEVTIDNDAPVCYV